MPSAAHAVRISEDTYQRLQAYSRRIAEKDPTREEPTVGKIIEALIEIVDKLGKEDEVDDAALSH